MHHIDTKQLEGTYKTLLASSSEDHKKLWAIITIKRERFHTDQRLHFEVEHNGTIVHSSSKVALAVSYYNKIQIMKTRFIMSSDEKKQPEILCTKCALNNKCALYIRGKAASIKTCVAYKPE